jgi:hypothetical protein
MRESSLLECLDGITPRQWYEFLNGRVFLWATLHRLEGLLAARAYRAKEHLILKVDSRRLVAKYRETVLLSPINSGSTLYKPVRRNIGTFSALHTYPFEERRKMRGAADAVAEVAFARSTPDISEYVGRVERRRGSQVLGVVWERE